MSLMIRFLLCVVFGMAAVVVSKRKDRERERAGKSDTDEPDISVEEQLYNHMFRRYNNLIRPVKMPNEAVNVQITFSLMQIHSLDEKVQVFRTYGWLVIEWPDARLAWKSANYQNMTEFVVDSNQIWTPELALINAVEYQFPDFSQYRAIVNHKGNVRWEPAGVFETSCQIDITFYPYDIQKCDLVFGTWAYTSYQVNLTNSTPAVILDDYNTSGEWHITRTTLTRKEFMYECCPNIRFSKVSATIFLSRRHRFYTMNLIMPCAMLSSLTLVTFLSPPDQGEKISLGISILLSFSVFMLTLSENMPKTSETLPLFGIYTTFVMLMNTTSVMLTVLVLNLHHRHNDKPVPNWVRTVVFQGLARILCMHSKEKRYNDFHMRYGRSELDKNKGRDKTDNRNLRPHPTSIHHTSNANNKDGYSVSFAAAQLTSRVRNSSALFPAASGGVPNARQNSADHSHGAAYHEVTSLNLNNSHYRTDSPCREEYKAQLESLIEQDASHPLNVQSTNLDYLAEWKKVARIVDRLFFWLTLLTMISVSVGTFCLLWL